MAKIQPLRDLDNNLVAPVTHERAVYGSDGVRLEKKINRLGSLADSAENGAIYSKEVLDLSEYHASSYYIISTSGKWNSGTTQKHIMIDVTKTDIVSVTANETTRAFFWFLSKYEFGRAGADAPVIGSCNIVPAGEQLSFAVPENAVGMAVTYGTPDETDEGNYANKPAEIVLYNKIEQDVDTRSVIPCPVYPVNRCTVGTTLGVNATVVGYTIPVSIGDEIHFELEFEGTGVLHWGYVAKAPIHAAPLLGSVGTVSVAKQYHGSLYPDVDGYFVISTSGANAEITSISAEKANKNPFAEIQTTKRRAFAVESVVSPYEEIDLSVLAKKKYYVGNFGTFHSETMRHVLVPVKEGGRIKVIPNDTLGVACIAWFTTNDYTADSYVSAPLVPGTYKMNIYEEAELDVPSGALFCYVLYSSTSSGNDYIPSYFGYAAPLDESSPITPSTQDPVIMQRNPKDVYEPLMLACRQTHFNRNAWAFNSPETTTLLWFTDIHADTTAMKNIIDWNTEYGNKYFDDVIATGDQVQLHFYENFSWWNTLGGGKVLQVIGNHDSWAKESQFVQSQYPDLTFADMVQGSLGTAWPIIKQKYVYDKFFAPFVDSWNVVQPVDAAENGYCYYYKDYDAIRLIVLDCMHYCRSDDWDGSTLASSKQHTWVQEVLEDARENNKPVVVATHMNPARNIPYRLVPCSYNSSDSTEDLTTSDVTRYIKEAIADFVHAGGEFVCYIVGHSHTNALYTINTGTEDEQFVALLTCASARNPTSIARGSAGIRVVGTKTEDSFNVITFDTVRKLIKIVRVGANINDKMEEATKVVYRYANATDDWGNPLVKGLVMCQ